MRRRKLIILLPLLLALGAVGAYAWFSAIGSGTGQASVGSLGAPTGVTGSASGSTVHVSWNAPSGGAVAPSGYYVTRNDGTSDAAACGSSAGSPLPASPTSCDDSSVASGTYTYTVTAVYRTWTATSAASSAVTVSAAATKLVFTTGAQTLTAGVVSGTITVQRQNASGTPTTGGTTTVDLTTSSTAGVFRNSGDTATITTVTIADGTSSASFKYTDTKAGTPTITAADHAGTLTSASQQETVNPAAASQLSFTQSPSNTSADNALSPQPKVTVQDQFGNTILGDTSTVTLSITSGTPTSGGPGSLTGCTQTEASGVVSFSGCAIRTSGTGYKLHVTDGSLAAADSSAFSITTGAADATQSTLTPTSASMTANGTATQALTVRAKDAFGNNETSGGATVTITKSSGTGTIGSVTDNGNGTYTATVTAPTATGSGVFVATLGGSPVKSGTASQTTSTITYVPGPADATQSTLTPTSASITANGTATQVLTVTAKDAFGNNETSGGATVTITKSGGTGAIGSVTDNGNGTYTATVTAPTATGSGVFVATLGGNPVKSGSASQTTSTITYIPGPADATQSTLSPTSASITANGTATQVLTVTAKDANGNLETTGGATVTITKSSGTGTVGSVTDNGNGTYTATVTAPTATGSGVFVATLGGSPVKSGTASQTTSTVSYVAGPVSQLVFTTQPAGASGGAAFTTQPVVTARDANGNTVTSYSGTVTLSIKSGTGTSGATLSGCTSTLSSGVTSFTGCTINRAGTGYVLTASDGTRTVDSNAFNVSVGTVSQLVFTTQPSDSTGGVAFPTQPVVTAEDAGGNTVTTYSGTVTLSIKANSGTTGATLSGCSGTLSSGVITFSGCAIDKSGTQYRLVATDGTLTSSPTSMFNITVGPVSKFVVSGFADPTVAGAPHSFTVTATDAGGNTVTGYTGTVKFTSSDTQAVLPANSTLTNGTGSFNATLKTAGEQSITATDTVTSTITGSQSAITVTAAAATVMKFVNCSLPTTANTTCSGQPLAMGNNGDLTFNIQTQDQFGNPSAPTATVTITFSNSDSNYTITAGAPATITTASATSGQVTLHHASSNTSDTLTAHASATFSDVTLTAKK